MAVLSTKDYFGNTGVSEPSPADAAADPSPVGPMKAAAYFGTPDPIATPENLTLTQESAQQLQGTPVAPGMPTTVSEVTPQGLNERGQKVLLSPEAYYKGIPEAAANVAGGIANFTVSGIANALETAGNSILKTKDPVGEGQRFGQWFANKIVPVYQPKSESGKEMAGFASGVMNAPFDVLQKVLDLTPMSEENKKGFMQGVLSGLAFTGAAKMARPRPKPGTIPAVFQDAKAYFEQASAEIPTATEPQQGVHASPAGMSDIPSSFNLGEPYKPSAKALELSMKLEGKGDAEVLTAGELRPGDVFARNGEKFKVEDKTDFGVKVADGVKFTIKPDQTILADQGSVKLKAPEVEPIGGIVEGAPLKPREKAVFKFSEDDANIMDSLLMRQHEGGNVGKFTGEAGDQSSGITISSPLPRQLQGVFRGQDVDIIAKAKKGEPLTQTQHDHLRELIAAEKEAIGFTGEFEWVKGEQLTVGDKFEIRGEKFKVEDIDPETGKAIVKDGIRYEVDPQEDFAIDTGTYKPSARETGFEPPSAIKPQGEGFDFGMKGKDLLAPERVNKPVSMEELPLGRAMNEARDREAQVGLTFSKGNDIIAEEKGVFGEKVSSEKGKDLSGRQEGLAEAGRVPEVDRVPSRKVTPEENRREIAELMSRFSGEEVTPKDLLAQDRADRNSRNPNHPDFDPSTGPDKLTKYPTSGRNEKVYVHAYDSVRKEWNQIKTDQYAAQKYVDKLKAAGAEQVHISKDPNPSDKIASLYRNAGLESQQELYAFPGNLIKYIPGAKELQAAYERPPQYTEAKRIIGHYDEATQEMGLRLTRVAKEINKALPKDRQEAITNYMQAGGDIKLLSERSRTSKKEYRKGYEDALNLTKEEKVWADSFRKRYDDVWQQAHEAGILEDYIENYVRGEWEKPQEAGKKLIAQVNSGMFRKTPKEALHKVFQDYFEGEQAGYKPKNKQIGYQLIAAELSITKAIETRKALRSMMESTMPDGRPMVSVGGAGSMLEAGTKQEAYFVKPNIKGKDTGDYKFIDHPSLRKWKWVDKDSEGKPIFMEGNMWIHPDAFPQLNALLGKSKIRTYTVPERVSVIGGTQPGRAALEAGAFVKGTILLGPFHQFHVAEHAIFHKVNPFRAPEIDFDTRPVLREGVSHGLMLYNHNALAEFGEGLSSGGLFHRIPGIKKPLIKYQEYLFQDYIPRLKAAMFEHAVTRAEKYYAKELASGKFTRDQLLDNAAKQANAAFGEMNYKYMGRNPTLQDALRLGLLAPDFLEARLKFAGQAMRPYGKEQTMALVRGAIIMATTAQALNILLSDDHKPHWDKPFSLIFGDREYTPRSVVGDIGHLISDPRSFWYHRINPLWGRPVYQLMTGKNQQGQKVDFEDNAKELLKSVVPIPAQGIFKKNTGEGPIDSTINALLSSIGVSNYAYKTKAERYMVQAVMDHMKVGAKTEIEKRRYQVREDLIDRVKAGELKNGPSIHNAAREMGVELSAVAVRNIMLEPSKEQRLKNRFKMLTIGEAEKAWELSTPDEKKLLRPEMLMKISRATIVPEKKRELVATVGRIPSGEYFKPSAPPYKSRVMAYQDWEK